MIAGATAHADELDPRNSSMYFGPSRPRPGSSPPNGPTSDEGFEVFAEPMPYSSASLTRNNRVVLVKMWAARPTRCRSPSRSPLHRLKTEQAGDRAEGFLAEHLHFRRHAGQHGRLEKVPPPCRPPPVSSSAPCPRVGDMALDLVEPLPVDDRPLLDTVLHAVPDLHPARPTAVS